MKPGGAWSPARRTLKTALKAFASFPCALTMLACATGPSAKTHLPTLGKRRARELMSSHAGRPRGNSRWLRAVQAEGIASRAPHSVTAGNNPAGPGTLGNILRACPASHAARRARRNPSHNWRLFRQRNAALFRVFDSGWTLHTVLAGLLSIKLRLKFTGASTLLSADRDSAAAPQLELPACDTRARVAAAGCNPVAVVGLPPSWRSGPCANLSCAPLDDTSKGPVPRAIVHMEHFVPSAKTATSPEARHGAGETLPVADFDTSRLARGRVNWYTVPP